MRGASPRKLLDIARHELSRDYHVNGNREFASTAQGIPLCLERRTGISGVHESKVRDIRNLIRQAPERSFAGMRRLI